MEPPEVVKAVQSVHQNGRPASAARVALELGENDEEAVEEALRSAESDGAVQSVEVSASFEGFTPPEVTETYWMPL